MTSAFPGKTLLAFVLLHSVLQVQICLLLQVFIFVFPPPICRVLHAKCWAEWSTNWNQDFWENINNLRYADHTTLMAESKEEWNSLLINVKEESGKAGLKLNIKKIKIMASDPIRSLQIEGESVTGNRLYFLWAPKSLRMVTAAMQLKEACFLEEKQCKT